MNLAWGRDSNPASVVLRMSFATLKRGRYSKKTVTTTVYPPTEKVEAVPERTRLRGLSATQRALESGHRALEPEEVETSLRGNLEDSGHERLLNCSTCFKPSINYPQRTPSKRDSGVSSSSHSSLKEGARDLARMVTTGNGLVGLGSPTVSLVPRRSSLSP